MPGEADVLAEHAFMVIADLAPEWQGRHRFRPKIGAVAGGESERPHLVRPEGDAAAHGWIIEIHPGDRPRFGPRRKRRVLHFDGVIELADSPGERNAGGVARTPDHRIVFVLFLGRPDAQKSRVRRGGIFDRGDVFVGQRRVDEWIVPREMARHPGADDGGKLAGLETESAIFPRRDADGVFVEPNLRAVIAWIESAIDASLGKNVNRRAELRVDEQTEPRIEERVTRRPDEAGGGAAKGVAFQIERAADARPNIVIERGEGQRV